MDIKISPLPHPKSAECSTNLSRQCASLCLRAHVSLCLGSQSPQQQAKGNCSVWRKDSRPALEKAGLGFKYFPTLALREAAGHLSAYGLASLHTHSWEKVPLSTEGLVSQVLLNRQTCSSFYCLQGSRCPFYCFARASS